MASITASAMCVGSGKSGWPRLALITRWPADSTSAMRGPEAEGLFGSEQADPIREERARGRSSGGGAAHGNYPPDPVPRDLRGGEWYIPNPSGPIQVRMPSAPRAGRVRRGGGAPLRAGGAPAPSRARPGGRGPRRDSHPGEAPGARRPGRRTRAGRDPRPSPSPLRAAGVGCPLAVRARAMASARRTHQPPSVPSLHRPRAIELPTRRRRLPDR